VWTRLPRPVHGEHGEHDEHGVPDSVLTLTAIILLLRPLDVWWMAPFVLAAACLSLLSRAVRHAPVTWILVALLVAARIVAVWPLSDNHIYLLAYWCLATGSPCRVLIRQPHSRRAADGCSAAPSRWRSCGGRRCRLRRWPILQSDAADRRALRRGVAGFGRLSCEQMAQNRAFISGRSRDAPARLHSWATSCPLSVPARRSDGPGGTTSEPEPDRKVSRPRSQPAINVHVFELSSFVRA